MQPPANDAEGSSSPPKASVAMECAPGCSAYCHCLRVELRNNWVGVACGPLLTWPPRPPPPEARITRLEVEVELIKVSTLKRFTVCRR